MREVSPVEGCHVTLPDENNAYVWKLMIEGPPAPSPYEGGKFEVEATFPTQYPFKPPIMKFKTKIFHPNVSEKGDMCLLSDDAWSPTCNFQSLVSTIYQNLQNPIDTISSNPLNIEVATLSQTDPKKFLQTAKQWTSQYASSSTSTMKSHEYSL